MTQRLRDFTTADGYKLINPIVMKRAEKYRKHGERYRFDMLAGYEIAKTAYEQAQEDLKPVLEAARDVVDQKGYYDAVCLLADALAGLEE